MKILKTILVVLLGIQFTTIGLMKLVMPFFGVTMFIENMSKLGYSYTGTIIVGLFDLMGGVALFFPKYRGYAIIGLALLLTGGIGSHITAGDSAGTVLGGAGFCLVALAFIFFVEKPFTLYDRKNNVHLLS